jgi:DNA-binding XRE family transcriptional regulator
VCGSVCPDAVRVVAAWCRRPCTRRHVTPHPSRPARRSALSTSRSVARVRGVRARRSLTQEALGRECALHRNYVGAIERGEINPTFRILRKLATGLQLPLSELIALFEERWTEWEADRC